MKPLVKTTLAAVLFLVPMAVLCGRPLPKNSELIPLPFKARERPIAASLTADEENEKKAVLIDSAVPEYNPAAIPRDLDPKIQKMKKFSFDFAALEMKDQDAVRLKGATVGMDYHVDEKQSVGVEGSQQIYDRQDANAWGEKGKDESTAGIKYKLIF